MNDDRASTIIGILVVSLVIILLVAMKGKDDSHYNPCNKQSVEDK